jgi:hypothetical protein
MVVWIVTASPAASWKVRRRPAGSDHDACERRVKAAAVE